MYSKNVDKGSVAWHNMCLYSSTNLRVHFSTIVVVCNGDGSALKKIIKTFQYTGKSYTYRL